MSGSSETIDTSQVNVETETASLELTSQNNSFSKTSFDEITRAHHTEVLADRADRQKLQPRCDTCGVIMTGFRNGRKVCLERNCSSSDCGSNVTLWSGSFTSTDFGKK